MSTRVTNVVRLLTALLLAAVAAGCGGSASSESAPEVESAATTAVATTEVVDSSPGTDAPATPPPLPSTATPETTITATTAAPAVPAAPAGVVPQDVEDMLLPNDTCHGWEQKPEYRLYNGEYYDGLRFKMTLMNAVYEDFNGDGANDALFWVHCNAGAGDWTGSAIVKIAGQEPYVIQDETLMSITQLPPGSEVRVIHEVSFDDGVADVTWFALLPGDEYYRPWLLVDTYGTITTAGFQPSFERFRAQGQIYPEYPATPDEHFEWPNLYEVPQLGREAVRGSGCGLDTPIGDTLPDGWWYGYPSAITASGFEFDLACVYYGAGAHTKIADCIAANDPTCLAAFGEDFFPENNNYKTRPVAKSAGFVSFSPDVEVDSCDALQQYRFDLSIVHIVNGQADYMRFSCATGG